MILDIRRAGVFAAVTAAVLGVSAIQVVEVLGAAAPARLSPIAEAGVLSRATDTQQGAPSAVRVDRSARPTHGVGASTSPAASAPVAARLGTLLANFNGVGSLDSGVTNFGAEFEPPDQGLCAGNGLVVEMVNSAYRVFDTAGHSLAGPFNINKVFHDGFKQFTSDPRCQYDVATKTWFAVILFINNSSTGSRIDIATATDPTGNWTPFRIGTTHAGGPGCPCFGDQPTLGIDTSNIYITTNEFSILGPQFNGAQIYAVDKRQLASDATTINFVHYTNLTIGGSQAASVQPALTTGNPGAEYFLSSLDPNGTGDHRIGVWALTGVAAVGSGGVPTLSSIVIGSEPYAIPPPAVQKGSASTLDSGDDRMQQVQAIGGAVWGELDTTVRASSGSKPHAGAAWFRVVPLLSGSKIQGAFVSAQGYVVSPGESVLYPALQANASGKAAMVFTLVGPNRFAGAAYAVLNGAGFGAPVVAAPGTGPYDPAATRWGDYSWAVLDPSGTSVWMATEYMPPVGSQTTDGLRNWGTRVLQVAI